MHTDVVAGVILEEAFPPLWGGRECASFKMVLATCRFFLISASSSELESEFKFLQCPSRPVY